MPKVSRESATQGGDYGPVEDRNAELDGYTASFVTFREDVDGTPLLKGLPDDRCQCPHWGYVIKGRLRVEYADRVEVIDAGDAYYLAPGHVAICEEDSEVVEFSPKGEYQRTMEVAYRNYQALRSRA